jgi:DNA-binding helix-turn-helix protein
VSKHFNISLKLFYNFSKICYYILKANIKKRGFYKLKNIKIYLSNIRLSNEETQKEMAKKLGISDTALSFIENEVKPVDALFLENLFKVYKDLKGIEKQKIIGYYLHKKEEQYNKEKQLIIQEINKIDELIKFSNTNNKVNKFEIILKELIKMEEK